MKQARVPTEVWPASLRARRAAGVCVPRLSGDCVRGRPGAGQVQRVGGVSPQSPAALCAAACSEPGSHRWLPLWNNGDRWGGGGGWKDILIFIVLSIYRCFSVFVSFVQFKPTWPPTWRCWRKITMSMSRWVPASFPYFHLNSHQKSPLLFSFPDFFFLFFLLLYLIFTNQTANTHNPHSKTKQQPQ